MKKSKKGIIIFSCVVILTIAVIFAFSSNIARLLGNMYNIDEIGANIDSIKSGDKINYSANGVDDWEVLSVDKGSNIVEIVSTKPVENLEISGYYGWLSAKEKMLEIANKYVVGDYAVGARNLNLNDITNSNISYSGCIWLDDQTIGKYNYSDIINSYSQKYYCRGNFEAYDYNFSNVWDSMRVLVIINISDESATSYNVGDDYTYSNNGVDQWKVLSVNSDRDLSIVSAEPYALIADFATNDGIKNGDVIINNALLDFYNDDVLNVRIANYNDASKLVSAGVKSGTTVITGFDGYYDTGTYTNTFSSQNDEDETYSYYVKYDNYRYTYMYYATWGSPSYRSYNSNFSIYSVTYGVRPVIRLKYSTNSSNDKGELNTNIKVGDNVMYEANSYKNWKVLSINKEDNTAEIVSAGIVQLLRLRGINDYDNAESIFQEIVDDYMEGDNVISARMLISDDIEMLTSIKDRYSGVYWLGNKLVYKYKSGVTFDLNDDVYGIAVASYNGDSLNVVRQWVPLEVKQVASLNGAMSSLRIGSHEYTAGIRPVIKVKLASLVKDEEIKVEEKVIIPENKEKPVLDENIVANDENMGNNNVDVSEKNDVISDDTTLEDKDDNSCIVYDNSEKHVNNEVIKNNEGVSNKVLIFSVVSSLLIGATVSGMVVFEILKKRFSN